MQPTQTLLNYFSEEQFIIDEYNRKALMRDDEAQDPYLITIIDPDIEAALESVEECTEEDTYGLEGKYKKDFEEWKDNYWWYGKTFQEWTRDKSQYELDGWWFCDPFPVWMKTKKEYNENAQWFGGSFMEWVKEKKEYERELIYEMRENWEDYISHDGGRYN